MRLRMIPRCLAAPIVALVLPTASAEAQSDGNWFDISSGQGFVVPCSCSTDRVSEIVFPPYPFGEGYPPGSLVFVGLTQGATDGFATTYTVLFIDGCGCGGQLVKPVTYRFHYEESAVTWLEDSTTLYFLDGTRWTPVAGTSLETSANLLTLASERTIYGFATYGIGPPPADGTSTWGQLKALFNNR